MRNCFKHFGTQSPGNLRLQLCAIAVVTLIGFAMTACEGPVGPQGDPGAAGNNGQPGLDSYLVIFNSNGGDKGLDAKGVSRGGTVAEPIPTKTGDTFGGWYTDDGTFNDMWDFNKPVTANVTLYAKWFEFPAELQGTWVSAWGEELVITAKTFTNAYGGEISYAGRIVNHRDDDSGTGYYITIRYTENVTFPDAVGKYYVLHYKDSTLSSMLFAGAYLVGDGDGKPTPEEAETVNTVTGGAFSYYSAVYKTGSTSMPNTLEGSWSGGFSETFVITDGTVIYKMYGYPMFYGIIVNVRDNGDETGYITFRYLENGLNGDLVGKYCVLYWENFNDDSVDLSIANDGSPGDEGKDTQSEAETEYTIGNADYYWDIDTFDKG